MGGEGVDGDEVDFVVEGGGRRFAMWYVRCGFVVFCDGLFCYH